jgi:uncharacterized protein (DUF433 family)
VFGFNRITSQPNILGGKACIRGMRISVSLIVNLIANGMTEQEIMDEYPDLESEDIRQALRCAIRDFSGLKIIRSSRRLCVKIV